MLEPSLRLMALGTSFLVAGLAAGPLVRFNLWVYRKLGLRRLARFWERQLTWWIPVVRAVCVLLAVLSVLRPSGGLPDNFAAVSAIASGLDGKFTVLLVLIVLGLAELG